jgi:hypothetical protein
MSTRKRSGICSSCARVVSCRYSDGAGRPILDCDEHDGGRDGAPLASERMNVRPSARPRVGNPERPNGALGLCRTCDLAGTCVFTKPESGVWHCEEYL